MQHRSEDAMHAGLAVGIAQPFQRLPDAPGWPGRLITSALPRITATCRDRIAVGTKFRLICRICSPKPGITLCAIASVASGVTSPCRAGTAGGEHQIAVLDVAKLHQR